MIPLWENLYRWYPKFEKAKRLLLALDYDGTLTPIVSKPKQAKLSPRTRALLKELSKNPKITLCIVTGRPLREIKRLVAVKKAIYIANHGFEIATGKKIWIHPKAKKTRHVLKKIFDSLQQKLHSIPGILIEDKKVSLSIHNRNVPPIHRRRIKNSVIEMVKANQKYVKITHGKRVYEIRPKVGWDKGKALLKIDSKIGGGSARRVKIYIGDDLTDEDVFKILPPQSLTIRVGHARSSFALCYVTNTQEVYFFLKILHNLTSNPSP